MKHGKNKWNIYPNKKENVCEWKHTPKSLNMQLHFEI
jgi:hypothetical protein